MKRSICAILRPCAAAAARAARSARRAARRSRRSRRRTRSACRACSSATRLTTALMKSRSWLTSTTAPAYSARKPCSHSTDARSRWLVGSSRSSRSGFCEQQPGQRHAHHPAAGELGRVALHVGLARSPARPGCAAPPPPARSRPCASNRCCSRPYSSISSASSSSSRSPRPSRISMWRIRRSMPLTAPAPASTSATARPAPRLGHLLAQVADHQVARPGHGARRPPPGRR